MRNFYLLVAFALLGACSSTKLVPETQNTSDVGTADSAMYEMIVMDPGFETWFVANSKPEWYHDVSYYEQWNHLYTQAWNAKISSFPKGHILNHPVDYNPGVHYGIEINHKLFYYYQYVERVLRIPILKNRPGYVKGFGN